MVVWIAQPWSLSGNQLFENPASIEVTPCVWSLDLWTERVDLGLHHRSTWPSLNFEYIFVTLLLKVTCIRCLHSHLLSRCFQLKEPAYTHVVKRMTHKKKISCCLSRELTFWVASSCRARSCVPGGWLQIRRMKITLKNYSFGSVLGLAGMVCVCNCCPSDCSRDGFERNADRVQREPDRTGRLSGSRNVESGQVVWNNFTACIRSSLRPEKSRIPSKSYKFFPHLWRRSSEAHQNWGICTVSWASSQVWHQVPLYRLCALQCWVTTPNTAAVRMSRVVWESSQMWFWGGGSVVLWKLFTELHTERRPVVFL